MGGARRMIAALGTESFCLEYLSPKAGRRHFTKPFADAHRDAFDLLDDPAADRVAIASFRGFGKTTCVSLGHSLYRGILDAGLRYVRFAGATEDLAKERMEDLRVEIKANRAIREDFGDLAHPKVWDQKYIRIQKPGQAHLELEARESCAFKVASPKTELRGTKLGADRLQLVIVDDPEPRKRTTAAERARFVDWFLGDLEPAVAEDGGKIILIANLSTASTLIARILDGWPHADGRGGLLTAIDEERAKAWGEWRRRRYACMVPDPEGAPDPDDPSKRWRSAFPDRLPVEVLFQKRERLRLKGKMSLWWAEWMADPRDAALQVFSREALDESLSYALRPPRDYAEAVRAWPALQTCAVMDPAFSKSETANRTAVAVSGNIGRGWFPLLDYYHGVGLGLADRRDLLWRLDTKWHFSVVGIEYVGAQADLWESFLEDMKRKLRAGRISRTFEVRKVKPPHDKSKTARIGDLAWAQVQGIWRLAASHGEVRMLEQDYRGTDDEDDDLLDVCEMVWRVAESLAPAVISLDGFVRSRVDVDDPLSELDERESLDAV